MTELRSRHRSSAPAAYWWLVGLSVVLVTVPAVPGGDVDYASDAAVGAALWALMLFKIGRGSRRAWLAMTMFAALSTLTMVVGLAWGVGQADGVVFQAAMLGIFGCLLSPALRAHVLRRERPGAV